MTESEQYLAKALALTREALAGAQAPVQAQVEASASDPVGVRIPCLEPVANPTIP